MNEVLVIAHLAIVEHAPGALAAADAALSIVLMATRSVTKSPPWTIRRDGALLPLPRRQPGRVWLLRAPRGHASIDETVRQMSDSSWAAGAHPDQNKGDLFHFLQHCEHALKGIFGQH